MLFGTPPFVVFMGIVALVNFTLPSRIRWAWLLFSSYYFYVYMQPSFAVLVALTTVLTWWLGLMVHQSVNLSRRRVLVIAGLCINGGLLIALKYFNFLNDSIRQLFTVAGLSYSVPALRFALPLGISFYTFKVISYLVDCYHRKIEPERHIGKFALYVVFFPQILAGPIERASRFLPQAAESGGFDYDRTVGGLRQMLWGFFIKVIIADRLAVMVNQVYSNPSAHGGPVLVAATYMFALQIYCDFAGYSDIAIGAARVLGFDPAANFARPYFSKSIAEFWRRWHISLSSWFKDYLYIPIGGSRVVAWKWHRNVLVVFLVSGLWHGASWNFVIWGLLHGLYLVLASFMAPFSKRAWEAVGQHEGSAVRNATAVVTTFHLATFAWIFFKANTLPDAVYIARHLFSGYEVGLSSILTTFNVSELSIAAIGAGILLCVDLARECSFGWLTLSRKPVIIRWAVYCAIVLALANLRPIQQSGFIYLQF